MSDIVALGETLIDFTALGTDGEGFPCLQAHPGGAPANFLAAAARRGLACELIASVGTDAFGVLLREALVRAGVGVRGLRECSEHFTTLAFVTLRPDGEREFSFARKNGADLALSLTEEDKKMISECTLFHFGTLSLTDDPAKSATAAAVDWARGQRKLVSCDPNLRLLLWESETAAREAVLWAVSHADVVKLSREEGEFLFGTDPAETAARLLSLGARLVFVTRGAEGCYTSNGDAAVSVPAFPVQAVDATGAGDIFFGSAMAELLRSGKAPETLTEEELRHLTRVGCAAAALSVTRSGGISSVPAPEETDALLKE